MLRHMPLAEFLARFGCKDAIHSLEDARCKTVTDLTDGEGKNFEKADLGPVTKEKIKAILLPC
jgi:hypothetical protein